MNIIKRVISVVSIGAISLLLSSPLLAQRRATPIMGWSSWNTYRIHINEALILSQADAMSTNGMSDVGYTFINIDDGFFSNRDSEGTLQFHKEKFPNGMKYVADYIHGKGLLAGIYAEAGINTCGAEWDNDKYGVGAGSFGFELADCKLLLNEYGYDFLKIDYCGAKHMGLDEEQQYTKFSEIIREIAPEAIYNVCRWEFPGTWVTEVADSWRVSGDISDNFESITHIIDKNRFTSPYAGPGHFNDMDMLQIGRGMSAIEDRAHFSMWSILTSPLLAGNDLTTMSKETLEILTNEEVIAVNQDIAAVQGRLVMKSDELEVYVKPLGSRYSNEIAVAVLNRTEESQSTTIKWSDLGIEGSVKVRDLWAHQKVKGDGVALNLTVPSHGVNMYKATAKNIVAPTSYEAEYAFVKGYKSTTDISTLQPLHNPDRYIVQQIGEGEWIEWQDIYVEKSGTYTVNIESYYNDEIACTLTLNGSKEIETSVVQESRDGICTISAEVKLKKGINSIKLDTPKGKIINIDRLTIE